MSLTFQSPLNPMVLTSLVYSFWKNPALPVQAGGSGLGGGRAGAVADIVEVDALEGIEGVEAHIVARPVVDTRRDSDVVILLMPPPTPVRGGTLVPMVAAAG